MTHDAGTPTVPLREYLDRRIDDLRDAFRDRFQLNDDSIAKAERTMNERLNSMNEFRDALRDQANRMATRAEVEKMGEDVQELRRAKANLDGRLVIIAGGISAIITISLGLLLRLIK